MNEIPPNITIIEFVVVGPKMYRCALSNGTTVLKVKRLTLKSANCDKVNFESLRDSVDDYCLSGEEEKKEIRVELGAQKSSKSGL